MKDDAPTDVLGLKAQAAQRAYEARGMSPAKALRRAMSRTADALWDLALVVHSVGLETLDQDGVLDLLGKDDLLVLLDGPDGAIALATLDRQVLTGLVEVQTILQVTQMPLEERGLTATDAAMAAPLVDGALTRFAINLDEHPLRDTLEGFTFGAMIEDQRAVGLLLDAPNYRAFRADVDLALGRRRGAVQFIFPEYPASDQGSQTDGPGPYAEQLARVPARLDAVLVRVKLPLNEAQMLKPGDLLDLPGPAIDNVELVARGSTVVARGRMGQLDGHRAVRLNWPHIRPNIPVTPDPSFDDGVPQLDAAPAMAPDIDLDIPLEPAAPLDEPMFDDAEAELPPLDFEAEAEAFDDLAPLDMNDMPDLETEFAMSPMDLDVEEG